MSTSAQFIQANWLRFGELQQQVNADLATIWDALSLAPHQTVAILAYLPSSAQEAWVKFADDDPDRPWYAPELVRFCAYIHATERRGKRLTPDEKDILIMWIAAEEEREQ